MSRMPYPDVSTLPELTQKMLAGSPLNIVRMGAHASPAIFQATGQMSYACVDPENIPPRWREAAILRVGWLSHSEYELHHHRSLARAAGLTDEEVAALEERAYSRLDPVLAAIAAFTDETVLLVSASDETLERLRAQISEQMVINLVLCIGLYMSMARLIGVGRLEIDDIPLTALATGVDKPGSSGS